MSAKQLGEEKEPKTWEMLGAFFAYFAVAKDVPGVYRTLAFLASDEVVSDAYVLLTCPANFGPHKA